MKKEITIYKACRKFPETKSRAFQLPKKSTALFFMLDEWPERFKNNKTACQVKCIKIQRLYAPVFTTVPFKVDDAPEEMLLKDFEVKIKEYIKEVRLSLLPNKQEILNAYKELLGFPIT